MTRKIYEPKGGKGHFRAWNPKTRKVVSLGTAIREDAERIAREMWLEAGVEVPTPTRQTADVLPRSVPPVSIGAPSVDAQSVLAAWATGGQGSTTAPPPSVTAPPTMDFVTPVTPIIPIDSARRGRPPLAKQTGLTPEQAAKLGSGLTKLVTKINVIAAEVCVQVMGRDPFPLEDDELQMVALGWEMFLEEYFVKHKPKPWMMIAAGNVMMIFAMYMKGTPREKPLESQVPGVGEALS